MPAVLQSPTADHESPDSDTPGPGDDDSGAGGGTISWKSGPKPPKPDNSSNTLPIRSLYRKDSPANIGRVADYGYRYYDPLTGRWPSRDPIGDLSYKDLKSLLKYGVAKDADKHSEILNIFLNRGVAEPFLSQAELLSGSFNLYRIEDPVNKVDSLGLFTVPVCIWTANFGTLINTGTFLNPNYLCRWDNWTLNNQPCGNGCYCPTPSREGEASLIMTPLGPFYHCGWQMKFSTCRKLLN